MHLESALFQIVPTSNPPYSHALSNIDCIVWVSDLIDTAQKWVGTIEVPRYIPSYWDIHEFHASWMTESWHIEDHIVKNDDPFAFKKPSIDIIAHHHFDVKRLFINVASPYLIDNLK